MQSTISRGIGARWHWKTRFLKDSNKIAALAKVDLVVVTKKDSGYRLLRNAPDHIFKALLELEGGPSSKDL